MAKRKSLKPTTQKVSTTSFTKPPQPRRSYPDVRTKGAGKYVKPRWTAFYHDIPFWGMYSCVRRLKPGAQWAMQLRRVRDDDLLNVGFGPEHLVNIGAIEHWANGSEIAVPQVFDQSGRSNHIFQFTASEQLELIPRGFRDRYPALRGDGTRKYLGSLDRMPGGQTPYTTFTVFSSTVVAENGIVGWGAYGTGNAVVALRTKNVGGTGFMNYWWSNDLQGNYDYTTLNGYPRVLVNYWSPQTGRAIRANRVLVASDTPTGKNTTVAELTLGAVSNAAGVVNIFADALFFEFFAQTEVRTNWDAIETELMNFYSLE